jgi:hypothetical protein
LPPADLEAIICRTIENGMWQRDRAMPEEAWNRLEDIVMIAGLLREQGALERDIRHPVASHLTLLRHLPLPS